MRRPAPLVISTLNETQTTPKTAIRLLLDQEEWQGLTPEEINNGDCDEFAFELQDICGGQVLEIPNDYDHIPTHVFIKWKGQFYDAQHPDGVEQWSDLSIFDSISESGYDKQTSIKDETDNEEELRQKIESYLKLFIPEGAYQEASSGQMLNDSFRASRKLGELFGKRIVFFETTDESPFSFDGVTFGDKRIFIDINSQRPALFVLGHELAHELKRDHEDLWGEMIYSLIDQFQNFEQYKNDYLTEIEDVAKLDDLEIREELLGDLIGYMFTQNGFWEDMHERYPFFSDISPENAKEVPSSDSKILDTYFVNPEIVNITVKTIFGDYAKRQLAKQAAESNRGIDPDSDEIEPEEKDTVKPEEQENTGDVGAELVYNKRNRYKAGLTWEDIKNENTTFRVKEVIKSKVFPRPDYKTLVDEGIDKKLAYRIKLVYDSIASKPRYSDDEDLQEYIKAVRHIMEKTFEWVENEGMEDLAGTVYPPGTQSHNLHLLGGFKVIESFSPTSKAIRGMEKDIEKGWPEKLEMYQKKGFKILDKNSSVKIKKLEHLRFDDEFYRVEVDGRSVKYKIPLAEAEVYVDNLPPFLLVNKLGQMIGEARTEESCKKLARELAKPVKKRSDEVSEKGISVTEAERSGDAHRPNDEDISSQTLMDTFGFKGVNFGNWMKGKTNEKERQLHLNFAYDSFMDLANVLNIPPDAISLGGMIGIAFGAQGNGSFAAHFVPGVNEINLTRTNGAGSLAHEYGHAIDHYLGRRGGFASSTRPFITENSNRSSYQNKSDLPPELVKACQELSNIMKKRPKTFEETQQMAEEQVEKAKSYIASWINYVKRFIKHSPEAAEELDLIHQKMLELKKEPKTSQFSIEVQRIRNLHKRVTGKMLKISDARSLQANENFYRHAVESLNNLSSKPSVFNTTKTEYYKNAIALDKGKQKPYWSTSCEMFARAFDSFVTDTLAENNQMNTYLSHAGRDNSSVPQGEDRSRIKEAMTNMISNLDIANKTDEVMSMAL